MTQASKLKTVIRARAAKTGETYTAARRHVLAAKAPEERAVPAKQKERVRPEAASLLTAAPVADPRVPRGELSDRTARKSTGHGLAHWFSVLDAFGEKQGHAKAADYLYAEHGIQAWHAQMITVTWERARGLRKENQSCTGTFQVSVSRTLDAPVPWVVSVINDGARRKEWLKTSSPALRRAIEEAFAAGKSMEIKKPGYARLRYKWLSSVVELRLTAKGTGKSSLVADSSDLPDSDSVALRREWFTEALDCLRAMAAAS